MTLGARISRCRKDLGISQEELGGRLGVSRQAVSKWETDKAVPDMENLLALSKLFDIAVSDLTSTPPEKPKTSSKMEKLPETTETAETSETPKPLPCQTAQISLRFLIVLGLMVLFVLLLLVVSFILLFHWNSIHISEGDALEFLLPVEKTVAPKPDAALLDPDSEPAFLSDAQMVYQAFNQLAAGEGLTAEERFAYRRDLFAYLPSMDWTEFGRLGTTEESDCIFALMDYLVCLEDYSESELYRLQRASIAKGIDGAYAEYYSSVLSEALLRDPIAFVRQLTYDDSSGEPWPYYAMSLAAYGLSYFPEKTAQVADILESALSDGSFTEEQSGWCRLLRLYLETEDGNQSELPKTPEELRD